MGQLPFLAVCRRSSAGSAVTPRHVESSQTRDRICIGRQILNHWATREVLLMQSDFTFSGSGRTSGFFMVNFEDT